jgi:hypothetical protein
MVWTAAQLWGGLYATPQIFPINYIKILAWTTGTSGVIYEICFHGN